MTCSVLLDLDGTLIDSHPGILASCLAALRALGHEPDETLDIRGTIGPPLEDLMQILLQSYGDDRVGEAVAAYRQHYGESGFLGSVPYPGIGKSLEEMKRTGLRIYLATSKRTIFASRILDHLKFATYFDGIYGSVPSGELDHKPELLAHILSKHSLSPSHSLMVGDRRHDISGAHAVGMRGLGVLWGYGTRDELETAGANQLVDSPADLARTVLSMVNGKESPGEGSYIPSKQPNIRSNDPGAEIADRVIKFLLHSRTVQLWYVFPAIGLVLTSESPCRGGSSSHSWVSQP
jgi:phosphoglycolate phosphatase